MYIDHQSFEPPPDNTKIWRYLNFAKLISLIEDRSLYFASVKKLSENDPFEGSYAKGNLFNNAEDEKEFIKNYSKEDLDTLNELRAQSRIDSRDKKRKEIFVNSWCMNNDESMAMWKCYAEAEEGIAIQSTFQKLKASLNNFPKDIYIGKVNYIDYEEAAINEGNIFNNFIYKRKSFEHEKELRAVFSRWGEIIDPSIGLPEGEKVGIEIETLIENIYVSPIAPEWIKTLIESILKKYLINIPVIQSSMLNQGLW